jgi:hypothetical protein
MQNHRRRQRGAIRLAQGQIRHAEIAAMLDCVAVLLPGQIPQQVAIRK